MSWTESAGAARALFPSLGYFGSTEADCFTAILCRRLRHLRLWIDEGPDAYLTLQGLALMRGGEPLVLRPGSFRTRQSSVFLDFHQWTGDALLRRQSIHTSPETRPWWELDLAESVQVDELRVYNRGDRWGSRSRMLTISGELADGRVLQPMCITSPDRIAGNVVRVLSWINEPSVDANIVANDPRALRESWVASIASRIRSNSIRIGANDVHTAIALIPIWDADELDENEMLVFGASLDAMARAGHRTTLLPFERCVGQPSEQTRLAAALRTFAAISGETPFEIRDSVLVFAPSR